MTPEFKKYRLKEDLYYIDPNWDHSYALLTKGEIDDHICILYKTGDIFEYDPVSMEFRNETGDVSIEISKAGHLFEEAGTMSEPTAKLFAGLVAQLKADAQATNDTSAIQACIDELNDLLGE